MIDHSPVLAASAKVVTPIGPAHGPIAPIVARSTDDLAVFADRFDDSIEVYSPDPVESLRLLAPFFADQHVVLLFALDGDEHPDATLFVDGVTITAHLTGADHPSPFRPAHAVRHLVGFAVAERDLPAGYRLG